MGLGCPNLNSLFTNKKVKMRKVDTGFLVFSMVSLFSILNITSVSFEFSSGRVGEVACSYSPTTLRYCAIEDKSVFDGALSNDSIYSFTALMWDKTDKGVRDTERMMEDVAVGGKSIWELASQDKIYKDIERPAYYKTMIYEGEQIHLLYFNSLLFIQIENQEPLQVRVSYRDKEVFDKPRENMPHHLINDKLLESLGIERKDIQNIERLQCYLMIYRKRQSVAKDLPNVDTYTISDLRPGTFNRTATHLGKKEYSLLYITDVAEEYEGNDYKVRKLNKI